MTTNPRKGFFIPPFSPFDITPELMGECLAFVRQTGKSTLTAELTDHLIDQFADLCENATPLYPRTLSVEELKARMDKGEDFICDIHYRGNQEEADAVSEYNIFNRLEELMKVFNDDQNSDV